MQHIYIYNGKKRGTSSSASAKEQVLHIRDIKNIQEISRVDFMCTLILALYHFMRRGGDLMARLTSSTTSHSKNASALLQHACLTTAHSRL